MSTAPFTPSHIGADNDGGDELALFLTKWGNEIVEHYNKVCVMRDLVTRRRQDNSKAATFPVFGLAAAHYHVPGDSLDGQVILGSQRTINADSKMVADVWVDEFEEILNHFDIRGPYTRALAEAMAVKTDKNLIQLVGTAARDSATTTDGDDGSALTYAGARTVGADLGAAIYEAAQKLDEKSVPEMGRVCLVRPAQYNLLVQSVALINNQWGGAGSYSDGTILRIGGVRIVKTNHLPITDLSTPVTGENNTYVANFANTAALVFHPDAIGMLEWQGMKLEMERSVRNQGTLIVSKQIVGAGILRPEAAVEIKVA